MKYNVIYKFTAKFMAEVEADSLEDAIEQADEIYTDADFGEAFDIDGEAEFVEDDNENRIWEKED